MPNTKRPLEQGQEKLFEATRPTKSSDSNSIEIKTQKKQRRPRFRKFESKTASKPSSDVRMAVFQRVASSSSSGLGTSNNTADFMFQPQLHEFQFSPNIMSANQLLHPQFIDTSSISSSSGPYFILPQSISTSGIALTPLGQPIQIPPGYNMPNFHLSKPLQGSLTQEMDPRYNNLPLQIFDISQYSPDISPVDSETMQSPAIQASPFQLTQTNMSPEPDLLKSFGIDPMLIPQERSKSPIDETAISGQVGELLIGRYLTGTPRQSIDTSLERLSKNTASKISNLSGTDELVCESRKNSAGENDIFSLKLKGFPFGETQPETLSKELDDKAGDFLW